MIVYAFDDTLPAEQRVHTGVGSQPCPDHVAIQGHEARHRAVLDESRKREWGRDTIIAAIPNLGQTITGPDGSTRVDWRVPVNITFRPNLAGDGRALELNFPTLTAAQKSTIQAAVDNRFGVGRIFIT